MISALMFRHPVPPVLQKAGQKYTDKAEKIILEFLNTIILWW